MYPSLIGHAEYHVIPQLDRLELKRAEGWQHTFSWHMHDSYVLGVVTQGIARFTTSAGTHWVPPLSISIIHPQQAHSGPVHHRQAIAQSNCYPSVALIRSVMTEELGQPNRLPMFRQQVISDPALAYTMLEVHHQLCNSSSTPYSTQAARAMLATLMDQYAIFIPEADYWQSSGVIRQVCSYLRTHYREGITVQHLTSVAGGISEVHLTRIFRQQVGMPPYAYLTYRRVEEAKKLLQQQWSLTQTALETGFADQSHLTRQFKKMLGITPGTYRRLFVA